MITFTLRSSKGPRVRGTKGALRRSLSLFMTLLLMASTLLWPAFGACAAEENPVENAQHGVVRVACDLGEGWWSTGTGFAVGALDGAAQIFITNNHVVVEAPGACYITVTDIDGLIPAEVLYQDPARDLAVLRITEPLPDRHPLPLLSPKELHKSQDVFCLGFPGVMDEISDIGMSMPSGIDDITITKGTVSNPSFVSDGVTCIATDAVVNSGNSGGPMTDEYGQVVGVNTWGVEGNMNFAISIDHAIELLDSLGLVYTAGVDGGVPAATETSAVPEATGAPAVPEATEAPAGKWVLIAVGAALLIGVIICLLVLRGKKKMYVDSPPLPPPPPPEYRYCETEAETGREREPEREPEKASASFGLKAFHAGSSSHAVSHTPGDMHDCTEPSLDSRSAESTVTEKPAGAGLKKSSFDRSAAENATEAGPSDFVPPDIL